MQMREIITEIKRRDPKLKNYGIAKRLNGLGVKITVPGIDNYEEGTESVKLSVLVGLQMLYFEKDLKEFWSIVKKASGLKIKAE